MREEGGGGGRGRGGFAYSTEEEKFDRPKVSSISKKQLC